VEGGEQARGGLLEAGGGGEIVVARDRAEADQPFVRAGCYED
jgi:hypothetical protein